ncbi:hypothetical protein ACJX0J_009202, partial [Zea mays]
MCVPTNVESHKIIYKDIYTASQWLIGGTIEDMDKEQQVEEIWKMRIPLEVQIFIWMAVNTEVLYGRYGRLGMIWSQDYAYFLCLLPLSQVNCFSLLVFHEISYNNRRIEKENI